ncbi:MAG: hypothetical protein KDH97_23985, partial [Calditrichaeota bacterium]|nr:hypothetical protein [Calditrichota bacterium]
LIRQLISGIIWELCASDALWERSTRYMPKFGEIQKQVIYNGFSGFFRKVKKNTKQLEVHAGKDFCTNILQRGMMRVRLGLQSVRFTVYY